MEKEMLQILENSSMGEKETKAVYSEDCLKVLD
jgi:hypothetical protein